MPKLRQGTYFPEWLLERRKRAETAPITAVADCYLAGVSTRADGQAGQGPGHRLAGPFTFVAADALTMKVRGGGRVINAVVLVATGVNSDGHREVLGISRGHH